MSKQSLGRGLSALISSNSEQKTENVNINSSITEIEIDLIDINPYQPRKNFDMEKLNELAASVAENGIITPITVRKLENNKFQLIAGERRMRAAKIANLRTIPVYIINATNNIACEIAILENTQRENLSPIEEALGYQNLIDAFDYTQEMIAKRTGKSRSHIANILRILNLPKNVQEIIAQNKISLGHAKLLLQSANPIELANKILSENLTVRQVEKLTQKSIQKVNSNDLRIKQTQNNDMESEANLEIIRLEEILFSRTKVPTKIHQSGQHFSIKFDCNSIQELEKIVKIVIGSSSSLK